MCTLEEKVVSELSAKITPPIVGFDSTRLPPNLTLPPISSDQSLPTSLSTEFTGKAANNTAESFKTLIFSPSPDLQPKNKGNNIDPPPPAKVVEFVPKGISKAALKDAISRDEVQKEDAIKQRVDYLYKKIRYHHKFTIYEAIDSGISLRIFWINRCSPALAIQVQAKLNELQMERDKLKKEMMSLCYAAILKNETQISPLLKDQEGQKRAQLFFSILEDLDIEDEFWCLERSFQPKRVLSKT